MAVVRSRMPISPWPGVVGPDEPSSDTSMRSPSRDQARPTSTSVALT
ncbi:hypothetical protein AB0J82_20595 [Asanoa sp. NPDC049518]